MKPLDEPPLNMRVEYGPLGTWQIYWDCPTCGESGATEPQATQPASWLQAIIVESNHGEGRCDRG